MKYGIFDMDGTLTESMGVWEDAPPALLARYGKTARPDLRAKLMELTQEAGCRLIAQEYGIATPIPQLVEEYYQVVEELYGAVELKPGVKEALDKMAAAGMKMAIASSTRKQTVEAVTTRLGIRPYFAGLFSCRDGLGKKDGPYIYQEAAQFLGAQDPAQVWVFEDAYHAALTAKNGGFRVMGVQDQFCVVPPAQMKALCHDYIECWNQFTLDRLKEKE